MHHHPLLASLLSVLSFGNGLLVEARHPHPRAALLSPRATGFQLISNPALLQGSDLSDSCQSVLQQSIACDTYVASFKAKEYHGSLNNTALTNSVCAASCGIALTTARRRIAGACASTPELFPGYPILSIIDTVITGWNETCLKDKTSGKYCNDIIESWGEFYDTSEMPKADLCSYCYGAKLRMMQQSPYSVYDDLFASDLEYVNKACGVTGPITEPPNPIHVNTTEPDQCASGKFYKTQPSDTCDTIALAQSVSAASLFYLNPNLLNCTSISAGTSLCLPDKCDSLHQIKDSTEDCVMVAIDAGTDWMSLVSWNLALDSRCSNFWATTPFWGRVICVSPPGGVPEDDDSDDRHGDDEGTVGNGDLGGEGGSGDGYTDAIVKPPSGTVAKGTTTKCGEYVQAQQGVGCPSMLSKKAVAMDLFLQVNPSLGKTAEECDSKLVTGYWYCLKPFRYWNAGSHKTSA
ncbi:LysM domain protein [Mariannaea sp. PMI_226]|nr:LysM domain protein [Mariannaea sp. PMI_226]